MKFESLSAWRRFSVEEPQSPANFIRNESEPAFDARGEVALRFYNVTLANTLDYLGSLRS